MDRNLVEKLIQALIQTSDTPLTIAQLEANYKDLEGSFIPAQELGYPDTLSFLESSSDSYNILYQNGQAYVSPIVQGETKHVRELIKGQKKDPTKKVLVGIPAEVEEEILFLLATLPDNRLLVQDLALYYGSVYKKKLWYPKGKLPAWLSTAQRFVVINSPKGRYLEVLNNVDIATFQMKVQGYKEKLENNSYSSAGVRYERCDPYGGSNFSRRSLQTSLSWIDKMQKSECNDKFQTAQTRADDIPEDTRLLLRKILSQGSGGPVFISSLLSAFRLSGNSKSMSPSELLTYLRGMPECQITGTGSNMKVYLKPNWQSLVQAKPIRKMHDSAALSPQRFTKPTSPMRSRSLALRGSVADDLERPSKTEPNGHDFLASVSNGQVASHIDTNGQELYESENDTSGISNSPPSPKSTEFPVKDQTGPRPQVRLNGRGRIKACKTKCRLSVTNRVKLASFLATTPRASRAELIEQLRCIFDESPTALSTLDTLDATIADLTQPGGLAICDEEDRFSLSSAKPEGSLGDASKLSWIPQLWQDASQRPSTGENLGETVDCGTTLPVEFSLRGRVIALDEGGQYWFQPDSAYRKEVQEPELTEPSAARIEIGEQFIYAEPFLTNGTFRRYYALVLTGLSYKKYMVYLPELRQLRVVHNARLFPLSRQATCSGPPTIPPLIYVKAMGRTPYLGQQITIKVVADLQFGAVMACLETEECCTLLQVRDVIGEKGPDTQNSGAQPMVVLLVRWAGETLLKLDDATSAFGIENARESLTVLTLDSLPWSAKLKEHLQSETHLPIEPTSESPQLSFVRLVDVILLLDARSKALGGLAEMDDFLQEMIFLL